MGDVQIMASDPQFIHAKIVEDNGFSWFFTAIYGSPNVHARLSLWNQLQHIGSNLLSPWLLVGDFNAVLFAHERSSGALGSGNKDSSFVHLVEHLGLVDFGFSGARFTWCRGLSYENFKGARLDRALCTMEWQLQFPATTVTLPRIQSDHCPVLVSLAPDNDSSSQRPFKFQLAWFSHHNFKEWFPTNWSSPGNDFGEKLRDLTGKVKEWSVTVFGNLNRKKRRVWARLDGIQRKMRYSHSNGLIKLERKLREELDYILQQEE